MTKGNKRRLIAIVFLAVVFLLALSVSCKTFEGELPLVSKRAYVGETGLPMVVGEVKNTGSSSVKDILITVSFYCSSGKLIGEKDEVPAVASRYAEIEILAPGETSPFKVALSDAEVADLVNFDVNKFEKFKVEVSDYGTAGEETHTDIDVAESSGELDEETGQYELAGRVKNTGNGVAEQVKVVVTFYESESKIIDVAHTFIQSPLSSGEEAQFEITVSDKVVSQRIGTYSIKAIAR